MVLRKMRKVSFIRSQGTRAFEVDTILKVLARKRERCRPCRVEKSDLSMKKPEGLTKEEKNNKPFIRRMTKGSITKESKN